MRALHTASRALFCLALLAIIPAVSLAGGQATSPAPKSFATAHSVVVIGPNSPLFDSVLEKDFPGVDQVNYFQQIKPLLAIIHNNTRRVVKAYVVKWTITNSDGSTSTAMLPVMWEPPPGDPALAGTVTVLGPAGTGLGTQLVSPYFHWTRGRFPQLLKGNSVFIRFQCASLRPLAATAQNATSVRVTLDGAVFGDGVFVGPDTTMLYERFQAEQQARIDESGWMQNQLESGETDQQLRDSLSNQIYAGRNSTGTDTASLYTAARGEAASRLLSVLNFGGRAALKQISLQLMNAKRITVQRDASQ
ncbi:MAG: hypothetical protein ACRD2G_11540 [Terriglobia bacterium]